MVRYVYVVRSSRDDVIVADTYTWFVMARYVTDQLGGRQVFLSNPSNKWCTNAFCSYPYLPLIAGEKLFGPPFINPGLNPVIETTATQGKAIVMTPDDLNDIPTCSDSFDNDEAAEEATDGPFNAIISSFIEDSVYPQDYLDQRNAFIEQNLFVPSTSTNASPPKCLGNGVQPDGNFPFSVIDGTAAFSQICMDASALNATTSPTSDVLHGSSSGRNSIWAEVAFVEGCLGTSQIALGTTEQEMQSYCTTQFSSIINGVCNTYLRVSLLDIVLTMNSAMWGQRIRNGGEAWLQDVCCTV